MTKNIPNNNQQEQPEPQSNDWYSTILNSIFSKFSQKTGGMVFNDVTYYLFTEYLVALLHINNIIQQRHNMANNNRYFRNFDYYILTPFVLRTLAAVGGTIGGDIGEAIYQFIKNSINHLSKELFPQEQENSVKASAIKNTSSSNTYEFPWRIAITLFWKQLGKDKGKELAQTTFINQYLNNNPSYTKYLFKAIGGNAYEAIDKAFISPYTSEKTYNSTLLTNTLSSTTQDIATDFGAETIVDDLWEKKLRPYIKALLPTGLTGHYTLNYIADKILSLLLTEFSKLGLKTTWHTASIPASQYKWPHKFMDNFKSHDLTPHSSNKLDNHEYNHPESKMLLPGLINYSDNNYYHAKIILDKLLPKNEKSSVKLEKINKLLRNIQLSLSEERIPTASQIHVPIELAAELKKLEYNNITLTNQHATIELIDNEALNNTINALKELLQLEKNKLQAIKQIAEQHIAKHVPYSKIKNYYKDKNDQKTLKEFYKIALQTKNTANKLVKRAQQINQSHFFVEPTTSNHTSYIDSCKSSKSLKTTNKQQKTKR